MPEATNVNAGTDASLGPLVAADETLHHQVTNTFGAVASTDANWTEKIWLNATANDGTLQVSFGLGRYANRGVLDAYGGVSRGTEQWTVRGSRALYLDEANGVGPLHYEVIEPLRQVRVVLEPNEIQPIAFDITAAATVPAVLEAREVLRAPVSGRITNDVVRYHQAGTATGWVEVDGVRHDITADGWSSARDHSWGVRNTVGDPPKDMAPTPYPRNPRSFTSWSPILMRHADGREYVLFHYMMESNIPGQPEQKLSGGIEHPDGTREPFVSASWVDTEITDATRRFVRGEFHTATARGPRRWSYEASPLGTGFHLGTGLYFGLDGARHGQWRGELHVDGDYFSACDTLDVARRIHQLRDCVVHVVGDDGFRGAGVLQTVVIGAFEELGTTLAATFV